MNYALAGWRTDSGNMELVVWTDKHCFIRNKNQLTTQQQKVSFNRVLLLLLQNSPHDATRECSKSWRLNYSIHWTKIAVCLSVCLMSIFAYSHITCRCRCRCCCYCTFHYYDAIVDCTLQSASDVHATRAAINEPVYLPCNELKFIHKVQPQYMCSSTHGSSNL